MRVACPLRATAIVEKAALAVEPGMGDHGKIIFQTCPVGEPPQFPSRSQKVPVFPGAVQRGGIIINVIMDVLAVCVCGDKKGVLALCPAHGRFIADTVCLLRGNFSGLKRLPDLIAQYVGIPLLLPARDGFILGLAQKKLSIGGHVVALIGGNELAAIRFFRVLAVVETVFQGLRDCLTLADVVGF